MKTGPWAAAFLARLGRLPNPRVVKVVMLTAACFPRAQMPYRPQPGYSKVSNTISALVPTRMGGPQVPAP